MDCETCHNLICKYCLIEICQGQCPNQCKSRTQTSQSAEQMTPGFKVINERTEKSLYDLMSSILILCRFHELGCVEAMPLTLISSHERFECKFSPRAKIQPDSSDFFKCLNEIDEAKVCGFTCAEAKVFEMH